MMRPHWNQNINLDNLTPSPVHKRRLSLSCPNHPDKPATHSLLCSSSEEQISYCQKCSIMLASQGFNVVKLNRNITENKVLGLGEVLMNQRQADVGRFIGELNAQIQMIRQRGLAVEDQLRFSEQNYSKTMDNLANYFQQLQAIIEIQKYTAYNSILSQRIASQGELRSVRDALSDELQGLMGICTDIENNMEAVQSVEYEVYQTIMQNYRTKLSISSQIEDLQVTQIGYPVDFLAQIPQQLYTIADKIQIRTQTLPRPQLTPRQAVSVQMQKSGRSSKITSKKGYAASNCIKSVLINQKEAEHENQHVNYNNNYSFENSVFQKMERGQRRAMFNQTLGQKLMPNQMFFRESLNLTEIRQNQQEIFNPFRRFQCLEATIPEQVQSQESIDGYLAVDSIESIRVESQPEDTDTLLIC